MKKILLKLARTPTLVLATFKAKNYHDAVNSGLSTCFLGNLHFGGRFLDDHPKFVVILFFDGRLVSKFFWWTFFGGRLVSHFFGGHNLNDLFYFN